MRSFGVHAEKNRLWPAADTIIDSSLFGSEPFTFLFSFFDTGRHDIVISPVRKIGIAEPETLSLYVRSPLKQQDIVAHEGDTVVLATPPVVDRDVSYFWSFGGSAQYVSQRCSTRVAAYAAVCTGTGMLWVSDGYHRSPVDSFAFSLIDTLKPNIICANEGFIGYDTIYTGDTLFTFKVFINDGLKAGVDSASINGRPFDGVSNGTYYSLCTGMHMHRDTNPLELFVYALDRFVFGNESRDTFYLIFSDTIARSKRARIVVQTPLEDTTVTQSDSFYVSGFVENVSLPAIDLTMLLYVNERAHSTALMVMDSARSWEWTAPLAMGVNAIRIVAITTNNEKIDDVSRVIVRNPAAPDTIAPMIIDILADDAAADGLFVNKSSVGIKIRAFDEGVGIDTVRVNGKNASYVGGNWFQHTIELLHMAAGNEIVVVARDSNGNSTQKTVVIFRNAKPIVQRHPVSRNIAANSLYTDSIWAADPDGDMIRYSKSDGPSGLTVSSTGAISWTPAASDTGLRQVMIRVWDGYQPVFETYSLHVYPEGGLPPAAVGFATRSEDFPAFLEIGRDSLRMVLRITPGSGVRPFRFTVRLVDKDSLLLSESPESTVFWKPGITDTGYQQMVITVRDGLGNGDTLYPRVFVTVPNRPMTISVSFSSDTLPGGALNINKKQASDTLVFHINDPDMHFIERHSVSILFRRTQNVTRIDSIVADTFSVVVDASALDGYDTVIATVTDRGGNTSTFTQALYYGQPPAQTQLVAPENGATGRPRSLSLQWQGSDPDADALVYDVYFGTGSGQSKIGETQQTMYNVTGLSPATTYFWYIVSRDWKSQTTGPVWSFTTAP